MYLSQHRYEFWLRCAALVASFAADLQNCWPLSSSWEQLQNQQVPLLPCECCAGMRDPWCRQLHHRSACFDEVFTETLCCGLLQERSWSLTADVTHWSGLSLHIEFLPEDIPWWMQFWTQDFPQYGIYELVAWRLLHKAHASAIDIGANAGQVALLFAADAQNSPQPGRLVAVEADPVVAKLLRRHVGNNDVSNVKVLEGGAVGDGSGDHITLCSDRNAPVSFSPELVWLDSAAEQTRSVPQPERLTALNREAAKARSAALATSKHIGPWSRQCSTPVKVRALRMNEIFQVAEAAQNTTAKVDFVKVDVEGAEASILPAIVPLLASRRASIFVSVHCLLLGTSVTRQILELLVASFLEVVVLTDVPNQEPVALTAGFVSSFVIPDSEYFDVVATYQMDKKDLAHQFFMTLRG